MNREVLSRPTAVCPHIQLRIPRLIQLLCFLALYACQSTGAAEAVTRSRKLTYRQTAALAERFAPVLIFHPDEQFFPSSPLLSLNQSPPDAGTVVDSLGTPATRRDRYLDLTLAEKARLSTVYYRVHQIRRETGEAVVIEYWFYYVWNTYSARPGLFPFWFDGSHPNDMEQVRVVLELDPEGHGSWTEVQGIAVRAETIWSSAHEGMAPANRLDFVSDGNQNLQPHVLIELGSHAAATDNDRDGLFTPGEDGESGYKVLWGIRDRGYAWSRYNPEYMDKRDAGNAVSFCHRGEGFEGNRGQETCPPKSFSYRLVHVNELYRQYHQLGLSRKAQEQVFESKASWLKRLFGKSNGNSEKLVLPPGVAPARGAVTVADYSETERGFKLGATTLISDPGIFVGGRYSFLHGSKVIPDLMLDVEAVVTIRAKGYLSTAALLSYPVDAVMKVYGGMGLVVDAVSLEKWQLDAIAGFEVRLGGVRISASGRTMGSVTVSALDFRLYYFF